MDLNEYIENVEDFISSIESNVSDLYNEIELVQGGRVSPYDNLIDTYCGNCYRCITAIRELPNPYCGDWLKIEFDGSGGIDRAALSDIKHRLKRGYALLLSDSNIMFLIWSYKDLMNKRYDCRYARFNKYLILRIPD